MSTLPPPPRKPGAPPTIPPPTDFDEDAPTAVAPDKKPRADMPHEFDEGGELDEQGEFDEDAPTDGAARKRAALEDDDAPTGDSST
jgi:hypothetical protein